MQLKIAALGSDEFIRTPAPYIWRYHTCFLEHTDFPKLFYLAQFHNGMVVLLKILISIF